MRKRSFSNLGGILGIVTFLGMLAVALSARPAESWSVGSSPLVPAIWIIIVALLALLLSRMGLLHVLPVTALGMWAFAVAIGGVVACVILLFRGDGALSWKMLALGASGFVGQLLLGVSYRAQQQSTVAAGAQPIGPGTILTAEGPRPAMRLLGRLVGARVGRVERARMALVADMLLPSERLLVNAPAEVAATALERPGVQDGHAVIMFATDLRVLWAGFDGSGEYRPLPFNSGKLVHGVRYGSFRTFHTFRGPDRGGFGFLLLSKADMAALDDAVRTSITPVGHFLNWVDQTLGPGAGLVLEPVISVHPATTHVQMFVFPMWTPITESLITLINNRNVGLAGDD